MNIIMPMAGLGSRFRDKGYELPKPLIPVLGKAMYAWATESLPLNYSKKLVFILLRSQPEYSMLKADILERYKMHQPIVLSVPELTRGQSETVLAAKELIDDDTPLLIHNSDTGYIINDSWLQDVDVLRPDGALLVFPSKKKCWSFSKQDKYGRVIEVREKIPISDWASTGTYYFGNGRKFVELANMNVKHNILTAGEFYIAPLFNDLIKEGGFVKNYPVEELFCFGTPADLKETIKSLGAKQEI